MSIVFPHPIRGSFSRYLRTGDCCQMNWQRDKICEPVSLFSTFLSPLQFSLQWGLSKMGGRSSSYETPNGPSHASYTTHFLIEISFFFLFLLLLLLSSCAWINKTTASFSRLLLAIMDAPSLEKLIQLCKPFFTSIRQCLHMKFIFPIPEPT